MHDEVASTYGRAVKTRPILMSPSMVAALIDGAKSQTRRLIRPQPAEPCVLIDSRPDDQVVEWALPDHGAPFHSVKCPYGSPGDLLWVRETWTADDEGHSTTRASISYKADCDGSTGWWRPSIHMPRWASRITLRLNDVRAQRLLAASMTDIVAAGCPYDTPDQALDWFRHEWDTSYARRGYGWQTNPWVWLLEFDVMLENVDTALTHGSGLAQRHE